jgi:DNA-binding transcriptional ArsR family regulator
VSVSVSTKCETTLSRLCCEGFPSDILDGVTRREADDTRETPYGRRISDPGALRALAHAGRYAILEKLQTDGPSTATECAEVAGLSPSACSYHLRLLAKHGFVEPDDSRDRDGRERVWRAAITSWVTDPDPAADRAQQQAMDSTLTRVMLASSDAKVLDFADRAAAEPDWREAALMSNSTVVATVDELRAISAGLMAVMRPYFRTTRPAEEAPEGARQVHVSIRMAPGRPDTPP